jgi:hypothetical protein
MMGKSTSASIHNDRLDLGDGRNDRIPPGSVINAAIVALGFFGVREKANGDDCMND